MTGKQIILILLFVTLVDYANCQTQTMGLFLNTPQSHNGYTLFSNNEATYLIDNCGHIVNQWISEYKSGYGLTLTPEGDLLRAGSISGDFNAGGRNGVFELFSWTGELKWQFQIADDFVHAHHDLVLLPNGNFLCTIWEKIDQPTAQKHGRKYKGEVWSERILEIKILPNFRAEIVWEWSVFDHLIQDFDSSKDNFGIVSEHPELLDINYIGKGATTHGDWLHFNALDYNEEFDQIAVSSRNFSEILILDHSTTTLEAASHIGGRLGMGGDVLYRFGNPETFGMGTESNRILNAQHDIRWVSNGGIFNGAFIVFNNEFIEGKQSQVLIFENLANNDGSYEKNAVYDFLNVSRSYEFVEERFYSPILSSVQLLGNGNLLITEGESGEIFELNDKNELVWKYINPVNRNGGPGIQGGEVRFNSLFGAERYSTDFDGFTNKDLLAQEVIELRPFQDDCMIFEENVSNAQDLNRHESAFLLLANPVDVELRFLNAVHEKGTLSIFSVDMQMKIIGNLNFGLNVVDVSNLGSGIYFVFFKLESSPFEIVKFIKH